MTLTNVLPISLLALSLAACGGATTESHDSDASVAGDAPGDGPTGCPSAAMLSSVVGTKCSNEGLSCGGDKCTNACSFCNIIRCTGGLWTQQEAFPDPRCNDASPCSYPPANNDSNCPSTYSVGNYQKPCAPVGLACAYPGQGDFQPNGCNATAMMWCKGDAGMGTWVVAQ